jgi:hypothetical protein
MQRRLLLCTALLLLAGCGVPDRPPAVVAVSGKVVFPGGQPLPGGLITFHPKGPGKEAIAEIEKNGTFRLTSWRKDDGAMPGDYIVTVEPFTYKSGNPQQVPQGHRIPKPYWDEDTTQLRATVTAQGPNEFTFTVK